ncbi:MAG: hypothetical protein A2061_11010 [Gallionellales bacterium GWA2_59_43]|nr:MAG: hypothetical protein A2061_11010 [Gallionellales bacterium GWA2_59_43]
MMKQLLQDLDGLTDEKRIHKIVSERLTEFGDVISLKVLDMPERGSRLILITMDNQQAATSAINTLGVVSFGERSLIITVPSGRR